MRDTNDAEHDPARVSVHGGHSGEFCNHARDTLEQIVAAYINRGFAWVGITEHMPPVNDRFVYDDERESGLNAASLRARFDAYVNRCDWLRTQHRDDLEIFLGFETETFSGSEALIRELIETHRPDYIVGSLHHVRDMPFDTGPAAYAAAADSLGGLEQLYCRYFDEQRGMIEALRPAVVGHFDLIRIYDPEYKARLRAPAVHERVERNLHLVRELDLILDVNLAGFNRPDNRKAAAEQFPTREILARAVQLGIHVVPGDDSHGVETVGQNYDRGIATLRELGADLAWKKPVTR